MSQAATKVTQFPSADVGRALPHNEEAERCLLGSLLLNPAGIGDCITEFASKDAEMRGSENFYKHAHQIIYRCLVDMNEAREPVDLMTVTQKLSGRNQLDEVGGAVYLTKLLDAVPTAANLSFYLKIVQQRYRLRQLIAAGTQIVADSYETSDENVEGLIDDVEKLIFTITEEKNAKGIQSVQDVVKEAFGEIDQMLGRRGALTGLPTGFPELDKLLNGLAKSSMVVIAARPSMGKTSLAMNIVEHTAIDLAPKPISVGVFSLEMSAMQLVMRLLCSVAEVSMTKIQGGFCTQQEKLQLTEAASKIQKAKIWIDDTPALTIMELRAKARRMKLNHDIGLMVVDYLQLAREPSRSKYENRQQEIAEISGGLKALAKELNIPVIVISQLNREVEGRGGKPRLSDLRESGAIEQDADVVGLLARADNSDEPPGVAMPINLIVAKNRNGRQGEVSLTFRLDITKFFPSVLDEGPEPVAKDRPV